MSKQVIKTTAEIILNAKQGSPLCVGIDGIDAAGKTSLADALASYLTSVGYPIIRSSLDGFHNPKHIRYQRGKYSPEGYYFDSFNYDLLKEYLLEPLKPGGNRKYRTNAFDHLMDKVDNSNVLMATNSHILLFDGVFLFWPELHQYWDVKVFIDIEFQTCLNRVLERDIYLFGDKKEVLKRYQEKYIAGQKIYLESENPLMLADIVINNNDFMSPTITLRD